jgi:cyclophilin family peptidyl-prolyl cis-trans isomerase
MHAVVFGRVLEGLEIVDKLQNIATDRSGRPGQKVVSVLVLVCLNTGWPA